MVSHIVSLCLIVSYFMLLHDVNFYLLSMSLILTSDGVFMMLQDGLMVSNFVWLVVESMK